MARILKGKRPNCHRAPLLKLFVLFNMLELIVRTNPVLVNMIIKTNCIIWGKITLNIHPPLYVVVVSNRISIVQFVVIYGVTYH